jgi:hypothetical protein
VVRRSAPSFVGFQEAPVDQVGQQARKVMGMQFAQLAHPAMGEEVLLLQETFQTGPWGGRPKLHSAHFYQLTSYLENLQATCQGHRVEGLLVYPGSPHQTEIYVL